MSRSEHPSIEHGVDVQGPEWGGDGARGNNRILELALEGPPAGSAEIADRRPLVPEEISLLERAHRLSLHDVFWGTHLGASSYSAHAVHTPSVVVTNRIAVVRDLVLHTATRHTFFRFPPRENTARLVDLELRLAPSAPYTRADDAQRHREFVITFPFYVPESALNTHATRMIMIAFDTATRVANAFYELFAALDAGCGADSAIRLQNAVYAHLLELLLSATQMTHAHNRLRVDRMGVDVGDACRRFLARDRARVTVWDALAVEMQRVADGVESVTMIRATTVLHIARERIWELARSVPASYPLTFLCDSPRAQ